MVSVCPRSRRPAVWALHFKMHVELLPAVEVRYRNHEVASRITDQSFDLALVVALGRSSELIREQIIALQLGEGLAHVAVFVETQLKTWCDARCVDSDRSWKLWSTIAVGAKMRFRTE